MPENAEKTAVYYINKRIDSLEITLSEKIDDRFDSLEKTIDAHLGFCTTTRTQFNKRVTVLESFKNKAVGAIALFLVLVGIWQATKVM